MPLFRDPAKCAYPPAVTPSAVTPPAELPRGEAALEVSPCDRERGGSDDVHVIETCGR